MRRNIKENISQGSIVICAIKSVQFLRKIKSYMSIIMTWPFRHLTVQYIYILHFDDRPLLTIGRVRLQCPGIVLALTIFTWTQSENIIHNRSAVQWIANIHQMYTQNFIWGKRREMETKLTYAANTHLHKILWIYGKNCIVNCFEMRTWRKETKKKERTSREEDTVLMLMLYRRHAESDIGKQTMQIKELLLWIE